MTIAHCRTAIVVSILFLLFSFGRWPYGYYMLLKISVTLTGVLLWYVYSENKRLNWSYFYMGMAILFNPIVLFPLGRGIWSLVDMVVLPPLFISLVTLKRYLPLSTAHNGESMKTCSTCGHEIPDDERKCRYCDIYQQPGRSSA